MQSSASSPLSARQSEIADLVVRGKSSRTIAEELCLSPRTVETHLAAVFNKFGVSSRAELIGVVLGRDARENKNVDVPSPSAGKGTSGPHHNLPLAVNSFRGRERELADLRELITTHRLVTLTGTGGIGKTRLALEVGFDLIADCADGVWFAELAPLGEGSFVASRIAQALSVPEVPNQPLLATLLVYLKQRTLVLILDNCEHVVEETTRIADALLRGCPGVRILATSREPLRIAGERSFRLPSLTIPTVDATPAFRAGHADLYAAVALFVDRALAVDRHFVLDDGNAPIVADICRRLDGIPLAIELAAARVTILSPQQLRERLDERFRVLTGGSRVLLPRHRTLRALIDWSHDLLGEHERALFRRLSVFVNGFTLEGAAAVGSGRHDDGDVFDVLASLVDKSLILAEPSGDALRYRMLESMRAYAREKLDAAGELASTRKRHLAYLRDVFAAARKHAERTGRVGEIDAELIAELEDARAALDRVLDGDEVKAGAELLVGIEARWRRIGLAKEGFSRLERLIGLIPAGELCLRSRLWSARARLTPAADSDAALQAALTAIGLAREANDSATLANALSAYGDRLADLHRFEESAAALAEGEALSPNDQWLRLRMLFTRARVSYLRGDLAAAALAYDQLVKAHLQFGNETEANGIAADLAEIEHERGQTERAVVIAQEVFGRLRASRQVLSVHENLCGYLLAIDRLAEARAVAREFLRAYLNRGEDDRNLVAEAWGIEHAALGVTLYSDVRAGAQLAGYTQAAFDRVGYERQYTEQATRTRLDRLVREALTPTECQALLAGGAALSREDAITLALASLGD